MALSVIPPDANAKTPVSVIGSENARIIVTSDHTDLGLAQEELRGPACRDLAIKFAHQHGLPSPGVNKSITVFPIDKDGNEIKDMTGKVARFMAEVSLVRKIT